MNRPASISITVLLVAAIGGLVALAAGAVLLLSAYANFKNTSELVLDSAKSFMESLEADVKQHLTPAEAIVEFLVQQAANGELDPALKHESVLMLSGALAAAPQVSDIAVWQRDGRELVVARGENGRLVVETEDNHEKQDLKEYLNWVRANRKLVWNEPFRVDGKTLVSVAAPLFREGEYIGTAAAGVSVEELSALVDELGNAYGITGFIIYGEDRLLAHSRLPQLPTAALDTDNPLYDVAALENPVIDGFLSIPADFTGPEAAFDVREIRVNNDVFLALSREIGDFGNVSWILGAYSPRSDWDTQIKRLHQSIVGGLFLLGLAILGAIILSRKVAEPVRKTATATLKIGNLDLDRIEPLPPSRITELNDQANAFNQMLDGLRWFETYVPRQLVRRLIQQKDKSAVSSRELELTVMFTDIVGFTANSETKKPGDIAAELNQHFEILNQCIEAEGGTLDKYIGDAAMAFWGAPEKQVDHAQRACRAALAMAEALSEAGHEQRIKIAIHTGPLIVGNIGAVGRMNYTVIGDTVNTCSRIEKLAGDLDDGKSAIILVSNVTANYLDDKFELMKAGQFSVKGRKKPVTVFRLSANSIPQ